MLHFPVRKLGSYLNLHRWPLEPPESRTEQSNVMVVGSKDLLFKAVVTHISYFAALLQLAEWAASVSLKVVLKMLSSTGSYLEFLFS